MGRELVFRELEGEQSWLLVVRGQALIENSGSYVMSYVLADQNGWLEKSKSPFEVVPLGDFAALRNGVNEGDKADFFMWEHVSSL